MFDWSLAPHCQVFNPNLVRQPLQSGTAGSRPGRTVTARRTGLLPEPYGRLCRELWKERASGEAMEKPRSTRLQNGPGSMVQWIYNMDCKSDL